jgi:hypothetical protein
MARGGQRPDGKTDPRKPKSGTLKGKVTALDPDWWKPMTDEEVEALMA